MCGIIDCTYADSLEKGFLTFITHLFLLQSIFPFSAVTLSYTSTAWFLSCLLIIYFFAPSLCRYAMEHGERYSKILMIVFTCACIVVDYAYTSFFQLVYFSPTFHAVEFAVGVRIYFLVMEKRSYPSHLLTKQAVSLFFMLVSFVLIRELPLTGIKNLLLIALPVGVAVYYFSFESLLTSYIEDGKIVRKISDKSLGIFLIHYVLCEIAGKYFFSYNPVLLTVIVFIISFAVGEVLDRFKINIERT